METRNQTTGVAFERRGVIDATREGHFAVQLEEDMRRVGGAREEMGVTVCAVGADGTMSDTSIELRLC